jgi:hypothetical protein
MDNIGVAIAGIGVVSMLILAAQSYLVYRLKEEVSLRKNKKR